MWSIQNQFSISDLPKKHIFLCLFNCLYSIVFICATFINLIQRLKSSFHVLHKLLTKNYPIIKTNI